MPRRTSTQVRQEIADLLAEGQAIISVAETDDRELSDDENTRIQEIHDEIGQEGDNPTGLWAEVSRRERIERIASANLLRTDEPTDRQTPSADISAIDVPIRAQFTHRQLKAFRGERAMERAYTAGQFLAAALFRNESSAQWCAEHGITVQNAMSGGTNSLGGFLVPAEMEQAIINLREERGVFRRESYVTPMVSDTKSVPRRSGGITAYFVTDNDSITASDKTYDDVNLTAKKLAALIKYSSELSEDAIVSIGDDLTAEIAYAFADKEDECGFNGDGTSTYGGIVGVLNAMNAGSIYTAAAGNTAFSTLDLADFEGALGQLPQYAVANAKWYISRVGFYQSMARLVDAAGGNTIDTLAGGPALQFLGLPVVITQVLNSTTSAQVSTNICAVGDLRMGATLGNRRGMSVMISEHAYFANDQLAIRGTQRFDINVHETGTSSAAGALIVLATPGA